jgi:hypothetical protein
MFRGHRSTIASVAYRRLGYQYEYQVVSSQREREEVKVPVDK